MAFNIGNSAKSFGGALGDEYKGLTGQQGIKGFVGSATGMPLVQQGARAAGLENFAAAIGKATGQGKGGPGMLGIGQYTPTPYSIQGAPYNNQNEQEQLAQQQFAKQLAQVQGRQAPQMGNYDLGSANQMQAANIGDANQMQSSIIDQGNSNQDRAMQLGLAQQLQDQMAGRGPSLAQQQLQQATDRNIKQAMGMAAATQGQQQGGLALRGIQNQQANTAQQAGEQSAQIRSQEMLNAQNQYAGLSNQMRGADIGLAQNQAQLQQQAAANNQAAQNQFALQQAQLQQQAAGSNQAANNQFALQQGQMNYNVGAQNQQAQLANQAEQDRAGLAYTQGIGQMGQQQQQNEMAYQNALAQQNMGMQGLAQKGYEAASKARGQMVGNLSEGITKFATMPATPAATGGQVIGREKVHVRLSPQEVVIPASEAAKGPSGMEHFLKELGLACGGSVPYMEGGMVPGVAKVAGDSKVNDTQHEMLDPGSVVIPRTAVQDPAKREEFYKSLGQNEHPYLQMADMLNERMNMLQDAFKARKRA